MPIKLPRIELAQGDVGSNARASRRWFKVIAWALEAHPDGLFMKDLRQEYLRLCELQGVGAPYSDDGEFQTSLSRQLHICIQICQGIGWLTFRLEKPVLATPVRTSPRLTPPQMIPEHKWILTKSGRHANRWHERKLARAITLHLLKVGLAPAVEKLRVPLGLLSAAIGIAKLVANWGEVQAMLEGIVAIVGGVVLALAYRTDVSTPLHLGPVVRP